MNDRNNTRSGRDASNDRERRTDGDIIGVDRMTGQDFEEWFAFNYPELYEELLEEKRMNGD